MLTGGGAQLHGLTEYLSEELKVEVTVSPDPVNLSLIHISFCSCWKIRRNGWTCVRPPAARLNG